MTEEQVNDDGICRLCMDDDKMNGDMDLTCDKCKYHVCFECMFEYIRVNRNRETLLCPHCRQDLFNLDDGKDVSDGTLAYMEMVESLKKWMICSGDDESDSSEESELSEQSDVTEGDSSDSSSGNDSDNDSDSDASEGDDNSVDSSDTPFEEAVEYVIRSHWKEIMDWVDKQNQGGISEGNPDSFARSASELGQSQEPKSREQNQEQNVAGGIPEGNSDSFARKASELGESEPIS